LRRPRSTRQRGACRPGRRTQDGAPAREGAAERNLDLKRDVAGSVGPRTVDDRFLAVLDGPPADVDPERQRSSVRPSMRVAMPGDSENWEHTGACSLGAEDWTS